MPGNLSRWTVVTMVAITTLLVAGCGSGGTTTSSSPTATATATATSAATSAADAAVCQDAAALRTSVSNLLNVSVGKNTVSDLRSNLDDVQAKLSALVSSAHGKWTAQVGSVQTALTKLRAEVTNLANGTGSVSAVVGAIGQVRTAAQNFYQAAKAQCPEV